MKTIIKITALFCFFIAATTLNLQAQSSKIGHANIPELLASFEPWKAAQAQLETYKKTLEDKISSQQKALEAEYAQVQNNVANFTPKQLEEKQQYFVKKDSELKQAAQKAQQELEQKTLEATKPIQEKLKAAVNAVAKEGGFNYIVDSSAGDLLFLDPSLELTAKIKAKM
jgi:outer membrane protein